MTALRKTLLSCTLALLLAGGSFASKATLEAEAKNLKPLMTSVVAQRFLDATADLPNIKTRPLIYKGREVFADETKYYEPHHGTPLAYVRPIEIMGKAGLCDLTGKRIFDFGYSSIGQLRLLASLGAHVVGVDVHPFLPVLYSHESDTGEVSRAAAAGDGTNGHLMLLNGRFPTDPNIRKAVGQGYDVIMSKNVLKRGYIHPEQKVDASMLIDIGVSDEEFVQIVYDALNKDGLFMMYNLAPPPNEPGKPYIPWADGRCPFDRDLLERIGFVVLEYNLDDHVKAHEMARALGWGSEADLKKDLFSHYTLVKKL